MDVVLLADYLVVLFPAIASAMVGFLVEVVPIIALGYRKLRVRVALIMDTEEHVVTIKEFVVHASFLGPAVGIVVGVDAKSTAAYYLAVAFFLGAVLFSIHLSKLLTQIGEREAKERHRRLAGTVRSIVRSELAKAVSLENGSALKPSSDPPTMETDP